MVNTVNQSQEDRIITEFLNAIGPWREHIVIVGGFALFIYKLYLSDQKLDISPVATRDIDSLIPRKIPEMSNRNIAKHLIEAGFTNIFKNVLEPPTESYVKEIEGIEIEVEFLTDTASRNDKNKNITIAGVVAQPLSYLTLSLQKTRNFQTYSNVAGRVVSPGAWIFHKGLTFNRRRTALKMLKDLYGIWYVASQLGDFSDQALAEFNLLAKEHSKWFETLKKNIQSWKSSATPNEWAKLESQDPSGKLRKLHFEHILEKFFAHE